MTSMIIHPGPDPSHRPGDCSDASPPVTAQPEGPRAAGTPKLGRRPSLPKSVAAPLQGRPGNNLPAQGRRPRKEPGQARNPGVPSPLTGSGSRAPHRATLPIPCSDRRSRIRPAGRLEPSGLLSLTHRQDHRPPSARQGVRLAPLGQPPLHWDLTRVKGRDHSPRALRGGFQKSAGRAAGRNGLVIQRTNSGDPLPYIVPGWYGE
jgi:hypothetical protein